MPYGRLIHKLEMMSKSRLEKTKNSLFINNVLGYQFYLCAPKGENAETVSLKKWIEMFSFEAKPDGEEIDYDAKADEISRRVEEAFKNPPKESSA
jgi:hypothetical protein